MKKLEDYEWICPEPFANLMTTTDSRYIPCCALDYNALYKKHYDELRGTIKPESKPTINRKSPSRFFKKPKKKSSMEAINDKIKQLDKDLLI